ncbi:kinase-like protein [Rhizopogon salebrosus TDB-379]|nr:kinase-like protein [Rhizopogon salebrosus TDB-379]
MEKIQKGIRRELKVWLSLKHSTIVPLLGTARVKSPLLALVSLWMPSGTLSEYLEKQATTITPSARVGLVKGIAEGLDYLHTKNVIHGDLHPGNVLIDVSGNPCLTDFGLATIAEDPELQWTTTTMGRSFDCRWRAPELIGIEHNPERPTFKSDIYSFGSVMIFIVSGDIPWKEKKSPQICIELSKKVTPARPNNVSDNHWYLIQKCWSFYPRHRPGSSEVLQDVMPRGIAAQKGTRDILQEYRGRPATHGEREGGKLSAVRRTASMIQDSRDMPGPSCMRNTDPQEDYLGRPRNVVLYGECGMGLINLITRRNITTTSLDARTATHPPYHVNIKGQCFKLWDTTAGWRFFTLR